jgi:hypothetical protein
MIDPSHTLPDRLHLRGTELSQFAVMLEEHTEEMQDILTNPPLKGRLHIILQYPPGEWICFGVGGALLTSRLPLAS